MKMRRVTLLLMAGASLVGAYFLIEGMLAQALLGGISEREVRWDRTVVWLIYFPSVGVLALVATYLVRRALRAEDSSSPLPQRAAVRLVLFPLAWILLSGCIYFADFASYLGRHPPNESSTLLPTRTLYHIVSATLLVGAALCVGLARRRSGR